MKLRLLLLIFSVCALVLPLPSHALEIKSGENVEVSSSAILSGSLFSAGRNLTLSADVPGDLFCAGQYVLVSGTVEGDVICAAQTIEITGTVMGDVRAAAQTITLSGAVEKNVTAFAQTVTLGTSSRVQGELHTGAQRVTLDGSVGKALLGGAETVVLNGATGDTKLDVETLTVGNNASISGDLAYTSPTQASIPQTARISGQTLFTLRDTDEPRAVREERMKQSQGFSPVGLVLKVLIYSLLTYLFVLLFPVFSQKVVTTLTTRRGLSLLTGLGVLVLLPVVLVALAITIIGIPVMLLALPVFAMAVFVGKLLVSYAVGGYLLAKFYPQKRESLVWQVVIGVTAMVVLQHVPIVGHIVWVLAMLGGLGAVVLLLPIFNRTSLHKPHKRLPN